jgi:tripartite-type tricarboxylate transporter receptor subunit TctC
MIFNNKSVLLALIQGEKLRALAVTADKRWPELPDVPTMREAGFPDFPSDIVYGLLAPAGTPDAIVDKLNSSVNKALQSPELRANLAKLGIEARERAFTFCLPRLPARLDASARMIEFSAVVLTRSKP